MPRRLKQVTLAAGAAAGAAAGTAKPATRRKGRVLPVQWLILSNRRGCHMVPRMTQRNWERTEIGDGTSIYLKVRMELRSEYYKMKCPKLTNVEYMNWQII